MVMTYPQPVQRACGKSGSIEREATIIVEQHKPVHGVLVRHQLRVVVPADLHPAQHSDALLDRVGLDQPVTGVADRARVRHSVGAFKPPGAAVRAMVYRVRAAQAYRALVVVPLQNDAFLLWAEAGGAHKRPSFVLLKSMAAAVPTAPDPGKRSTTWSTAGS